MNDELRALPAMGRPADDVLGELEASKIHDRDWRSGRVFSLVYSAGDEVHELHGRALSLFSAENGLNIFAFPSIATLGGELLEAATDLLGGGRDSVTGFLTSGGTESLLQVMKVARDEARERGILRPSVVAATSAHAAFTKAAELFDIELIRVGVDEGFRLDLDELADAISSTTIMLVGSAPSYPHGVIDPIEDLAALAAERGLLCHVDACMGGFLLPFLAELGHPVPRFDLGVRGVTSISADLHKYGYASKGVSVVLYADPVLARRQVFTTTDWLGGFYGSTVMAGSRPAGPVAAAWATMRFLGRDGYLRLAQIALDAAGELIDAVALIPGVHVLGEPAMTVVAIGADDPSSLDIFAVADELARTGGWYLDRQQGPDALHLTIHAGSAPAVGAFVIDLADAVRAVGSSVSPNRDAPYAADS